MIVGLDHVTVGGRAADESFSGGVNRIGERLARRKGIELGLHRFFRVTMVISFVSGLRRRLAG